MLVRLRRAVQAAFLALFLWLALDTVYHPIDRAGTGIKLFFDFDPLAALVCWTASHALAAGMLLAAITLAVTAIFGRWFCGWVCPFGTLHHLVGSGKSKPTQAGDSCGADDRFSSSATRQATQSDGLPHGFHLKYYVLAVFAGAALAGAGVAGWIDPLSFFFRSLAVAVFPALNDAVSSASGWIGGPVDDFLGRHVLALRQPHFAGSLLIGFLFALAVALNFVRPRFWCRYACPLGALLGIVGRRPLVRLRTNPEACNECDLCLANCQGGAAPAGARKWNAAECLYCLNCRSDCPTGAITLGFGKPAKAVPLDLGRRRVLASGAAGLGAALVVRTGPLGRGRTFNAALVRPPGAVAEEDFLARCIRCGACMKVCPTNAIQPAALEAGAAGVWTPVLDMKLGYCEYECTLCTQVCPSGAIRPLGIDEKQKVRIGLAYIDRNRCLPWALGRTCIVCEEHCPTPQKAIWFEEARVAAPGGGSVTLKQPHVDAELCIGCGICVNKCVVKGQPAILVSSAGETRNPDNGVLL